MARTKLVSHTREMVLSVRTQVFLVLTTVLFAVLKLTQRALLDNSGFLFFLGGVLLGGMFSLVYDMYALNRVGGTQGRKLLATIAVVTLVLILASMLLR